MNEQSAKNKIAWEHRAYEFWHKKLGSPAELAAQLLQNPAAYLKKHQSYFHHISDKKIANLCGSNGRKAVPLSLLGAQVTVFDISEENKKYALELARHANTSIDFIVTDLYDIDLKRYAGYFDMLYLEGGILHYFDDIEKLMSLLFSLLKEDGVMILSDFHPLRRYFVRGADAQNQYHLQQNYFDKKLRSSDVAYKHFFEEDEQSDFPEVIVRSYTLSEIINAVLSCGFTLQKFDEHRGWKNENIPWEFTIIATKTGQ